MNASCVEGSVDKITTHRSLACFEVINDSFLLTFIESYGREFVGSELKHHEPITYTGMHELPERPRLVDVHDQAGL